MPDRKKQEEQKSIQLASRVTLLKVVCDGYVVGQIRKE